MGSLFSRFTFNSTGNQFHSSGIAGNQKGIGTTSTHQTYDARKNIERRRINQYDAASLNHDYRREALPEIQQIQQKNSEKYKQRVDDLLEDAASNRERYIKEQEKKNADQAERKHDKDNKKGASNKVVTRDVVRAEKQAFNATIEPRQQLKVPVRGRRGFQEPKTRGYDPYK